MDDGPRSDRLRLRFVTRAEASLLEDRFDYEAGGFNDFGLPRAAPRNRPATPAEAAEQLRGPQGGVLFIEPVPEGEPIGTISYRPVRYGPNDESSAWQLGIEIGRDDRGRGFGSEAQRLIAEWLLETTPANRIEAQTDIENVAESRSLERAGFTRECVLRGAQFRAGAYHDLAVYSRLRTDSS